MEEEGIVGPLLAEEEGGRAISHLVFRPTRHHNIIELAYPGRWNFVNLHLAINS